MPAPPRPRVYVWYDYVCPYAYVGHLRAQRLARSLDVEFVWLPWEIHPDAAPLGPQGSGGSKDSPSAQWVDALADAEGAALARPDRSSNSNLALRGAEYAKDQGAHVFAAYHDAVFDGIWTDGGAIGDRDVLAAAVGQAGMNVDAFFDGIQHNAYQARLDLIDAFATKAGIQRVPTFVFGDQRIVGNDPSQGSLDGTLSAYLERLKALGPELATSLEDDLGLAAML